MRRKILFIGDGGESPQLPRLLAGKGVVLTFETRHVSMGTSILGRHIAYLGMAWRATRVRRVYDKIFIWQQYVAAYYHALSRLWPFAPRPYLVYYIISKKPTGLLGRIRAALFLSMMRDRWNRKTFFMSRADYLLTRAVQQGLGERCDVLNSFLLGTDYIDAHYDERRADYYFAGGGGNRHYAELLAVARSMPDARFVIACRPQDIDGEVPANVEVRTDAYHEAFDRLVLGAKAVLLPLADRNVMSGQLVCMQAFAAGKPVLMTRNNFITDWIAEAETLPFLQLYDSSETCAATLRALSDAELARLGDDARAYYDATLRETGFYRELAGQIVATAW